MVISRSEDKPTMLRSCKILGESKCVEAGSDVWYEILSRLPTKSVVVSKCVCKAWCDFASHILVQQRKMPFLPMCGVFFSVSRFANVNESYLTYVSLTTKAISFRLDSCGGNIVDCGYNEQLFGNLSIDLNPLYEKPCLLAKKGMFYTARKGLILTVHIDGTYKVVNPATNQVLELPKPPDNIEFSALNGSKWIYCHAIVNLSCPLSSTPCSFVVMRLIKPHKLVDIYYPKSRKWVQCGFSMEDKHMRAKWYTSNYVFLGENQTLFWVTNNGKVVALQFESLNTIEPKICAAYCISLPLVVRDKYYRTRLGESQGYLYLSHKDREEDVDGLWIWKHCGDFSSADPWILLFEISKTRRLCKPVAEKRLVKFYDDGHPIYVMGFHPEAAIVYFHIRRCLIFAYDLINDTLDEIAVLDNEEYLRIGNAHSYSPCLASLGPFMAVQEERDERLKKDKEWEWSFYKSLL